MKLNGGHSRCVMNKKLKKHKNERKKTNTRVQEIPVNQKQKFGADETKIRTTKALIFAAHPTQRQRFLFLY